MKAFKLVLQCRSYPAKCHVLSACPSNGRDPTCPRMHRARYPPRSLPGRSHWLGILPTGAALSCRFQFRFGMRKCVSRAPLSICDPTEGRRGIQTPPSASHSSISSSRNCPRWDSSQHLDYFCLRRTTAPL